jgi:hypothetical protein
MRPCNLKIDENYGRLTEEKVDSNKKRCKAHVRNVIDTNAQSEMTQACGSHAVTNFLKVCTVWR